MKHGDKTLDARYELPPPWVPEGWPPDQPGSVRGLKPTPYMRLFAPECFPDEPPDEELEAKEVANRIDTQVHKACAGRILSGRISEVRSGLSKTPQERTDKERCAVSAFLDETTRDAMLDGLHARLYTPRTLVQALHTHQLRLTDYRLIRALNRYVLPQWRTQVWKEERW